MHSSHNTDSAQPYEIIYEKYRLRFFGVVVGDLDVADVLETRAISVLQVRADINDDAIADYAESLKLIWRGGFPSGPCLGRIRAEDAFSHGRSASLPGGPSSECHLAYRPSSMSAPTCRRSKMRSRATRRTDSVRAARTSGTVSHYCSSMRSIARPATTAWHDWLGVLPTTVGKVRRS